jgi:hypothetical protein
MILVKNKMLGNGLNVVAQEQSKYNHFKMSLLVVPFEIDPTVAFTFF